MKGFGYPEKVHLNGSEKWRWVVKAEGFSRGISIKEG
jgi:hypothetical protein